MREHSLVGELLGSEDLHVSAKPWRSAPTDVRLADSDSLRAADDAWAAAVALTNSAATRTELVPYLVVESVAESSPASAAGLHVGDRILSVDKEPATASRFEELSRSVVNLHVARSGGEFDITLEPADLPDTPNAAGLYGSLGVFVREHRAVFGTHPRPRIPEREVGPSSGLVHALALVGVLSSHDLTAGRVVAATGDIGFDGTVFEVGGIRQKTQAAVKAGAAMLIVPAGNADEARLAADSRIQVVGVTSLRQAVEVLCATGGSPLRPEDHVCATALALNKPQGPLAALVAALKQLAQSSDPLNTSTGTGNSPR